MDSDPDDVDGAAVAVGTASEATEGEIGDGTTMAKVKIAKLLMVDLPRRHC
jgi:hypothetical protein